jgi:hypothetical protein
MEDVTQIVYNGIKLYSQGSILWNSTWAEKFPVKI